MLEPPEEITVPNRREVLSKSPGPNCEPAKGMITAKDAIYTPLQGKRLKKK